MARPRVARAADQLFRAGCQSLGGTFSDREPVLQARSRDSLAADGCTGDGGDGDRKSGGYHGGLLACAPGDPAWTVATAHHFAHIGLARWPNLHPARHSLADDRGASPCWPFPYVERARFRIRYRSRDNDGRGRDTCLRRDLEGMAVVSLAHAAVDRSICGGRCRILLCQLSQTV